MSDKKTYYKFSNKNRQDISDVKSAMIDALFEIIDRFTMDDDEIFGGVSAIGNDWNGTFDITHDDTMFHYEINYYSNNVKMIGDYDTRAVSSINDFVYLIKRDLFRVKIMGYLSDFIDMHYPWSEDSQYYAIAHQVKKDGKVEIFSNSRSLGFIEVDDDNATSARIVVHPDGEAPITDDEEYIISNVRSLIEEAIGYKSSESVGGK